MTQEHHDCRIDYVELSTQDPEQSKGFYGAVFGWTFQDYGPEYTCFADGRITGGFAKTDEVSTGGPLVVMYVVDLVGAEGRVRDHGGTIVREIFSFPGGRRFHFADPSGNVLAVWSDH